MSDDGLMLPAHWPEPSGSRDLGRGPPPDTSALEALVGAEHRLTVELLPDGRMRAPDPRARELLRDRLRHAELLDTSAEWAVVRPLFPGSEPQPRPAREVVAAGVLGESGLALVDLVGFLASGYQTGLLTVSAGEVDRAIALFGGELSWASSSAADESFGEFLARRGKLTREQLTLALQQESPQGLARVCVQRGLLAADEAWSLLEAHLIDLFDRLIAAERGVWSFVRVAEGALADSRLRLSTQGLLVDALRRADELLVYRQRLRSSDAVIQRQPIDAPAQRIEALEELLVADARAVHGALTVPASVAELMRALGKSEYEVTRAAYHLIRAGVVAVLEPEQASPQSVAAAPSPGGAREVVSVYSLAIREMFEEAARVGKASALFAATRAFLEEEARSSVYGPLLAGLVVNPDGSLDEDSLVAQAERDAPASQELNEALSELLFATLAQASELLGRRRGDDLGRRVKLIHGMLLQPRASESPP